jgi:hypothetical protein
VQMNPLSVYNAMYHDNRLPGTTMIIDLGAENTDLIIADTETIWMRSIPIGGNNFTETLVKSFKLNFAKAEELKRNAATSKYARQIFQAMRPVFADLVAEIQRSIGFYASVHRDSRIKRVLALGGTFKLPGLQKYLQQNLQLDVERLDTIAAAPSSDSKLAPTFNENILSIVSAYGLAIQAMGEGKITSSLLPQKIRREKLWKEKTKWFAAAAALFVVGTGLTLLPLGWEQAGIASTVDERQRIEEVKSQAQQLDSAWSAIEQEGGPDRQRIASIKSMLQYRRVWPNLLMDIHQTLPPQPEAMVSGDVQQVKQIPRGERDVILFEGLTAAYWPHAGAGINDDAELRRMAVNKPPTTPGQPGAPTMMMDPSMMGMEMYDMMDMGMGVAPPAADAGPAPEGRGFVVTVQCVSPSQRALQLFEEYAARLEQIKPDPNSPAGAPQRRYSIANAIVMDATQIRNNQQRLQRLTQEYQQAMQAKQQGAAGRPANFAPNMYSPQYDPGMMMMEMEEMMDPGMGMYNTPYTPFNPGQPGAVNDAENPAFQDRDTGEDIRNDWEATLVMLVVLDPRAPGEDGAEQLPEEGQEVTAAVP